MIGIGDFDHAYAFYAARAAELGLKAVMHDPSVPVAAWGAADGSRPNLFIGRPFNKQPPVLGNGNAAVLTRRAIARRACLRR
ncbi:MAG: hypothetical protein H7251_00315 [Acetobacteraceae bacterium]|nr:hypothetical protein [Acetobacteraceae bacterium]